MKRNILRILGAALTLILVLTAFSACGGKPERPADTSAPEKDVSPSGQDTGVSPADTGTEAAVPAYEGKVPKETAWTEGGVEFQSYFHKDEYGSDCAIVMANTGDKDLGFSITAVAKDENGAQIDEGYVNVDVLGAQLMTLRFLSFYTEETIYDIEYTVEFREGTPFYKDAVGDFLYNYDAVDNVMKVDVTNTGSEAAGSVMAYAIFFDASGALIYEASASVGDADGEIKPGKTQSCEMPFSVEYDRYEVYISGNYYLL